MTRRFGVALLVIGLLAVAWYAYSRRSAADGSAAGSGAQARAVEAGTPGVMSSGRLAPALEGLGTHAFPVTTKRPEAQRFVDQGVRLAYAFNHAEAERAFREAAQLDPDCAMCYWGIAYVLGPNINAPMFPENVPKAWQALQQARERRPNASERERGYIDALATRYTEHPPQDRKPLDVAYANAMGELVKRHPEDLDAATLHAEALLNLSPWDQWTPEGQPRPNTLEVIRTLESVLHRKKDHPGAIHFYIHATEASATPEKAEPYANTLGALMPSAGHIVHMPAHTYMRVGRYHEASLVNIEAAKADESYLAQCHAQGLYAIGYVPHNTHFLFSSASMEGWRAKAIEGAKATHAKSAHDLLRSPDFGGAVQHFTLAVPFVYVRFGQWDDILATAAPADDLRYSTGIWHYARGRARVARGELKAAAQELKALQAIATDPALEAMLITFNPASKVLQTAAAVLEGELAAKRRDFPKAVARLKDAVAIEDGLRYNEPADWQYPVRHSLGAVLLEAGRAAEAERVYRDDLQRNRENGWSLFGLMTSLRKQQRAAEADEVERRFRKAWAHADVSLTASRF